MASTASVLALGQAPPGRQPVTVLPFEQSWVVNLGATPSAPPASDTGHVYVPLRDGRLVAVVVSDGRIRWEADQPTSIEPTAGASSVYVGGEATLTSLDEGSGLPRWERPLSARLQVPALWDTGWLIVALASGEILALRGQDGATLWSRALSPVAAATPAIAADQVYVSLVDGRIVTLALATGEVEWERQLPGVPAPMLPLDDRIFVGTTDNFFYCLDPLDGRTRWRWRTGADIIGAPVVDERHVYFLSLDNQLRALDRRTGAQRWKRALATRPNGGFARLRHLGIISGLAPVLQLFELEDGLAAGSLGIPAELAAPPFLFEGPALADAVLLFVTGEGRLHAFGRASGRRLAPLDYLPGDVPVAAPPITDPALVTPPAEPTAAPTGPPPPDRFPGVGACQ